jgi:hypothetical protein
MAVMVYTFGFLSGFTDGKVAYYLDSLGVACDIKKVERREAEWKII